MGFLEGPLEPGDPVLGELSSHDVDRYFGSGVDEPHRIRVDMLLHQHFRERGLTGGVSQMVLNHLLGYGLGYIKGLVRSGGIFAGSRKQGWAVQRQTVPPHDIDDLSSEVVWDGFEMFRDRGLIDGRWSPVNGLSLKQYYANACVLTFPNTYRRWQRGRREWVDVQLMDAWARVDQLHADRSAEDTVVTQAVLDSLFEHIGHSDSALLELVRGGYTAAEIGELMRLKPHAVEVRISRARAVARRYLSREGGL
jgi:RNA polymerase sigma-70 factor (ECF subfamily)